MPIVTETLLDAAGTPIDGKKVTVDVTDPSTGRTITASYAATGTVVEKATETTGVDGVWSATLAANDDLIPLGTVYRITIGKERRYIEVPDGAGPYDVVDILTDGGGDPIEATVLAAHNASPDAHPAFAAQFVAKADPGAIPGARMILLGDSITAYNGGLSISGQALDPEILDSKGYWNWANILLGHPFNVVGNAGVGSEDSGQILARIDQVLDVESDWVCVLAGHNDTETDTTTANIQAIVEALRDDGRNVLLCTITPGDGSGPTAQENHWQTVNAWIKDFGRRTPGVVVADTAAAIQDMSASDFRAVSGYLVDSAHPSATGAAKMGRVIRNVLSGLVPTSDALLATAPADPTNLLTNPLIYGTGTALASSWAVSGGAASSYSWVDRTDGIQGKWFQPIVAAGGALGLSSNVSIGATLAVGETIRFAVEFECESLEAAPTDQGIFAYVQCYNGATFPADGKAYDPYWDTTYANVRYPLTSGVFRTPPITIPVGTTIVQVLMVAHGGGTYRWGRASLRKGALAAL